MLKDIYRYNASIRGTGYYLKPVHMVARSVGGERRTYYYIGRYWWRLSYAGKSGRTSRVRWTYVGREKPPGLPEPPANPFEGLRFYVVGDDVFLDKDVYARFRWLFEGFKVVDVCGEQKNGGGSDA